MSRHGRTSSSSWGSSPSSSTPCPRSSSSYRRLEGKYNLLLHQSLIEITITILVKLLLAIIDNLMSLPGGKQI